MDTLATRMVMGLILVAGLFLFANGYLTPKTQTYPMALRDAHGLLARTPLPKVVFGSAYDAQEMPEFTSAIPAKLKIRLLPAPGASTDDEDADADVDTRDEDSRPFRIDASNPKRIVWSMLRDGEEALRFTADLEARSEKSTRVSIAVTGPAKGRFGNVAQKLEGNPSIKAMYMAAMKEQIAAVMEHRDFNLTRIYPAMLAAATANSGKLMDNMHRAIEADQKRTADNVARAYAREAQGR